MKDLSLVTLHAEVCKCLAVNNISRACNIYGLYLAKGGKKDSKQLTAPSARLLPVVGFRVYYTILDRLTRQNSRGNKVQNIELTGLLKEVYASEYVNSLARKFGHSYDKEVKIQTNFCGNDIVALIILSTVNEVSQGKITKSGLTPINVTVNLSNKNLLHELALAHAVAVCNMISPNSVSRDGLQTHLVNLNAY